jgi:hypothetical protein
MIFVPRLNAELPNIPLGLTAFQEVMSQLMSEPIFTHQTRPAHPTVFRGTLKIGGEPRC